MRVKRFSGSTACVMFELFLSVMFLSTVGLRAQTTGQGALEGTVLDPAGAVVPNATITATNQASGVASIRKSSGAGLYSVTPLIPGIYTVTVVAPGFQTLKQENIEVNGLTVTGLNLTLQIGSTSDSVTVTTAPPLLQTASATVGAVITNETYESLPLVMGGQQRDPTSFATLAVGAQSGTRAPIFSGTGDYLAEVYIDGIPTTTIEQQGDNRIVSNGMPVESVDQLQIISSAPSAEYQGAGAINFGIKTGGDKYHGKLVAVVRNTMFDTWGFSGNQRTQYAIVNGVATQVPAGKAAEHQLEISASLGGPIPFTRKKGFFFVNYDQFHGTSNGSSALFTVPTALMRTGDFTELGNGTYIYNPLTSTCPTSNTCMRQPFEAMKNGVLTKNIIPSSYISPISQYEQKFLPNTNLPGLVNNYLTTGLSGYANHEIVAKVTYDLTPKQRLAVAFVHGVRGSIGYGANLPLPYTASTNSVLAPTFIFAEHNWVITSRMVNQFTYGYTRFAMPVNAPTYQLAPYRASDAGITGLPSGQAAGNFPSTTFSTSAGFANSQSTWVNSQRSYVTIPNSFNIVDNFVWTKGKHNLTLGFLTQWLESNAVAQLGASGIYTQTFAPISTANFSGTTLNVGTAASPSGYGYASFLLGAVNSGSTSVPAFSETGSRFHPISPYVQDDWKITPKLTANIGLRWDYLPPYREVLDRWSFLNATATNPLTNSPGQLEFAGYRGADISCQCHTPVPTWKKNFGPRLGIEYAPTSTTVFRAGYAIAYSHAGGVGGRGSGGPSTLGYSSSIILPTAVNTGVGASPSYYLNTSDAFTAAGVANANFGGPGYIVPAPTVPNASALTLNTGNYVNGAGKYVTPAGAPPFVDPYLSSRAPMFEFYNFGVQQAFTKDLTLTLNYSGSQSHHLAGATIPGYWSGQLDPAYVASLGSTLATDKATNILNAQATAANIAIAQAADSRVAVPYPGYAAAGAISTTPKIGHMLQPFPQYSSPPSSTYANIANLSYNALEMTIKMRDYKGINFTVNYTWSRNVGDDGTTRSAFPVPAAASSNGIAIPGNNRADRDVVTTDFPQNLNIFGVFRSPFGKGKIGGNNWFARNIAGGWDFSEIFTYRSGTGIYVVGSGCTFPSTGTCMPDLAPGRKSTIRKNGNFNVNQTYKGYSQTSYLDGTAFSMPNVFPLPNGAAATAVPISKIGDAPRYLGLRNPGAYNLNASLSRTFPLSRENVKFVFRADCLDVTNHVTFSMPQSQTWSAAEVTAPGSTSFGKLTSASGNRLFQFSGRIVF